MRIFIAIDFPQEVITRIVRISAYLQTQVPERSLKWVEPENLHLTLKFLGEIQKDRVNEIERIMAKILKGQPSFNITIEGLGMYPTASQPRVVWLGIKGGEPLQEIHRQMDQKLKSFGDKPEKRSFSPHLTIARVRQNNDRETIQQVGKVLSQYKVESLGTIKVESIQLYKSELMSHGPIYTLLLSVPLNQV